MIPFGFLIAGKTLIDLLLFLFDGLSSGKSAEDIACRAPELSIIYLVQQCSRSLQPQLQVQLVAKPRHEEH